MAFCALLFLWVLAAAGLGSLLRPTGVWSGFLPANAVLLGLMLRWRDQVGPAGWLAGISALILAEALTGRSLDAAALMTLAALAGIGCAWRILSILPAGILHLTQPASMFWLAFAAVSGGLATGLSGAAIRLFLPAAVPAGDLLVSTATEAANHLAILPVILAAPPLDQVGRTRLLQRKIRRTDLLPAFSVLASCAVAVLLGGPGAVAIPVLALLWCGMVYPVFPTALLTLAFAASALMVPMVEPGSEGELGLLAVGSFRLGAAAIAMAPITLSVLMQSRNELTARLRHLATHDMLTGIENRAAFRRHAETALRKPGEPVALLVIDIDHFRAANDSFGQPAGDRILREAVRRVSACLRPSDIFGRIGGEEFAVLLPGCPPDQAIRVAERLRKAIAEPPMRLGNGIEVGITASIGLLTAGTPDGWSLDNLLALADHCLFNAKGKGRNQVVAMTT